MFGHHVRVGNLLLTLLSLLMVTCSDDPLSPDPNPELWFPFDQCLMPLNRVSWHEAAQPAQLDESFSRGKLLWHTPIEMVPADYIWEHDIPPGENAISTFRMVFRPQPGQPSWAGITTYYYGRIDADLLQYFECTLRGAQGRLHFDFGRISEDANGDGLVTTEDTDYNGVVDDTEDVGLDSAVDANEPGYDPVTNPDPSSDNFYFMGYGACPVRPDSCDIVTQLQEQRDPRFYYEWLNGTEGNRVDMASLGRPDSEMLSPAGFHTIDAYYSFVIDLSDEVFEVDPPGRNGWRTFRIPVLDPLARDTLIGGGGVTADWSAVSHARVWFEAESGQVTHDTVEVAAWYFVHDEDELESQPEMTRPMVINIECKSTAQYVRDCEYQVDRLFDLGYAPEFDADDSVVAVRLFEEWTGRPDDLEALPAVLQIYPDSVEIQGNDSYANQADSIVVKQVGPDEYVWFHRPGTAPYVVFNQARPSARALGVWLVLRRASGVTDTIGRLSSDTLLLKSLKATYGEYSPSHHTWPLMWRNAYRIPAGLTPADINLGIFKGLIGTEGDSANPDFQENGGVNEGRFIAILGLDQYNAQGQRLVDGYLDDRVEVFRSDWGLVLFPHRRPFDSDTTFSYDNGQTSAELSNRVPGIYDYESQVEKYDNSTYYLQIFSERRGAVTYLGYQSIRPGSERAYVNGRRMVRNVDYLIDYELGRFTLMSAEGLDCQAKLRIIFWPQWLHYTD